MTIIFWNNWETLTEFDLISISFNQAENTFGLAFGLLGFGIVIVRVIK